jgi:hypothetical protein
VASGSGFYAGIVAVGILAGLTGATAGDFGRPDPTAFNFKFSFSFDRPRHVLAEADGEKELHDRLWRFLHAPQAAGWFDGERFEQPRAQPQPADIDAYYRWLGRAHFQSARVQYAAIGDAVAAELGTLPATFAAACAVTELDRQREIALRGLTAIEPGVAQAVADRRSRNTAEIGGFAVALRVRFDAYSYALDHVLVEAPDRAAIGVDERLTKLEVYVRDAEAGVFCSDTAPVVLREAVEQPLRSREEGPVRLGME